MTTEFSGAKGELVPARQLRNEDFVELPGGEVVQVRVRAINRGLGGAGTDREISYPYDSIEPTIIPLDQMVRRVLPNQPRPTRGFTSKVSRKRWWEFWKS